MMSPNPKRRIAAVDADASTRQILVTALGREGYDVVVTDTVAVARKALAERPFDAVIVDTDLPGENGLAFVRDLRSASNIGIVVLTARNDTVERIVALEMGADHYVTKPFEPRELTVIVRNLLWRTRNVPVPQQGEKTQFRFDNWLFDVSKRLLRASDGGTSTLTRQENAVLHALVGNAGKVMSRDQLMDAVNREWNPTDRTIDVLIGRLRRKIERDPANPEMIVTIYGEGYMFTDVVV